MVPMVRLLALLASQACQSGREAPVNLRENRDPTTRMPASSQSGRRMMPAESTIITLGRTFVTSPLRSVPQASKYGMRSPVPVSSITSKSYMSSSLAIAQLLGRRSKCPGIPLSLTSPSMYLKHLRTYGSQSRSAASGYCIILPSFRDSTLSVLKCVSISLEM
jgi:hypothetical protein